jgi:hypothetical protein
MRTVRGWLIGKLDIQLGVNRIEQPGESRHPEGAGGAAVSHYLAQILS